MYRFLHSVNNSIGSFWVLSYDLLSLKRRLYCIVNNVKDPHRMPILNHLIRSKQETQLPPLKRRIKLCTIGKYQTPE